MPSPAEKIAAIEADFDEAVETLRRVMQHVIDVRLSPELRVVILNNVIVSLTSTVEETIRDLFREYLAILEETAVSHLHLRIELQRANFACALEELKALKAANSMSAAATLATELSKCLNGEVGYRLLKDNLTYNKGNFKSQQLTDISKNAGVAKIFEKICSCEEIEEYSGKHQVEDRVNYITSAWNAIFSERDTIVHRISQAAGWGDAKISESFELCRLVIKRLSLCLSDDAELEVSQLSVKAAAATDTDGPT